MNVFHGSTPIMGNHSNRFHKIMGRVFFSPSNDSHYSVKILHRGQEVVQWVIVFVMKAREPRFKSPGPT